MAGSVMLLGAAQDAGVPHMACYCGNCSAARTGSIERQCAVSLGVVDSGSKQHWLIDCSPDIRLQYDLFRDRHPHSTLQGVLLTHLHMGHYIGLFQFGKESSNMQGLKVYGTRRVCDFFRSNEPWRYYLSSGNIVLVEGPSKRIFYCPDIDTWQLLSPGIRDIVGSVDVAFLDACFYSAAELPGRDIRDIPHPLVPDTAQRLRGLEDRVVFIHLNHTNPLWQDSPERRHIQGLGFTVGKQGSEWAI